MILNKICICLFLIAFFVFSDESKKQMTLKILKKASKKTLQQYKFDNLRKEIKKSPHLVIEILKLNRRFLPYLFHRKLRYGAIPGLLYAFKNHDKNIRSKSYQILKYLGYEDLLPIENTILRRKKIPEFVDTQRKLAFRIFHDISKRSQKKDILFSPFSITSLLMIYYKNLDKERKRKLAKALEFSRRPLKEFIQILKTLFAEEKSYSLTQSHAFWINKKYHFPFRIKNFRAKKFNISFQYIDFQKKVSVCKKINRWAYKKSNGVFRQVISERRVDNNLRYILSNILYFEAEWQKEFSKSLTRVDIFYKDQKNTVNMKFMKQRNAFYYFENMKFKMIEIPYKYGIFSLIVFLPRKSISIDQFEKLFSFNLYKEMLLKKRPFHVTLVFPKFTIKTDYHIKQSLDSLGIGNLLLNSDVFQKNYIDVNEERVKAASYSDFDDEFCEEATPQYNKYFKANRPFIFLIKDNQTESILFMGKLTNPPDKKHIIASKKVLKEKYIAPKVHENKQKTKFNYDWDDDWGE